jgi:digeranylgeranylglycerophospholipid reductase
MSTRNYDVVVVGAGTAGCFAAATAAGEGVDVVLLERKPEEDVGHIACGDAIKGTAAFPEVIDVDYLKEESFTNRTITGALFENPQSGETIDIPFDGSGAVIDRKRYGEVLVEEVQRKGADVHFDTVVNDVVQGEANGETAPPVEGVRAKRKGDPVTYEADVVIDAAGALSILQDKADLGEATFDTNVTYQQFCSAYREVIEVDEPVEWDDRIVLRPTEEIGYLWYFPRSGTEINAGLGFQMDKEPMQLVDELKDDINSRNDLANPRVQDKLGAALPTRRPYDSAVAPGFVAVGDAAGLVNPTTGGGIPGAAMSGTWATRKAIDCLDDGVDEAGMWEYNHEVMTSFGKKFAAMDVYNIWGGTHEMDELVDVVTALPAQQLIDVLGREGSASMSLWMKVKTAIATFGHWGTLLELKDINEKASRLRAHYDDYPTNPSEFEAWQDSRDEILEDVYEACGADPKY